MRDKLQRNGVYVFSQSVLKLLKLWNAGKSDNCMHSVIANINGNYQINENIYLSVPVKFENGSFEINNTYFDTNTIISEISQVIISFFLT